MQQKQDCLARFLREAHISLNYDQNPLEMKAPIQILVSH